MARGRKASPIFVSENQGKVLEQLIRRRSTPQSLGKRARLVLESVRRLTNTAISQLLPMDRSRVVHWRGRWIKHFPELCRFEQEHPEELEAAIVQTLSDLPRPGTPPTFTEQQVLQIVAIACEDPAASGRPISHWTPREVRDEAIKRGIVTSISISQVRIAAKAG
ncbi:helix-turn-helix domain-containing protein [Paenibacillus ginsengihumi]|uniref:helix-turn-helix domain-containing protein n=1 Tax=Paenibacillus ginsengihumi TaxID=431596 RepID=UPI00036826E4|nr:helix-turn-helix domain-containing protein [Paenibacillus ginsengihumi]